MRTLKEMFLMDTKVLGTDFNPKSCFYHGSKKNLVVLVRLLNHLDSVSHIFAIHECFFSFFFFHIIQ